MIRGEKYLASAAAVSAALALGGAACGGVQTCETPFKALSFRGDTQAIPDSLNTWQGVELDTTIPEGDKIRVDFTDPGGNRHISKWIDSDEGHQIAMRIGTIGTVIRTQIQASAASSICSEKPNTTSVKKNYLTMLYEGDAVPAEWELEPPD